MQIQSQYFAVIYDHCEKCFIALIPEAVVHISEGIVEAFKVHRGRDEEIEAATEAARGHVAAGAAVEAVTRNLEPRRPTSLRAPATSVASLQEVFFLLKRSGSFSYGTCTRGHVEHLPLADLVVVVVGDVVAAGAGHV